MQKEEVKKEVSKEVPTDLQEKVGALRATATIHNLLQQGSFKSSYHQAIELSVKFIESLHKQLMDEAIQHPDADLVPDLKAVKEQPVPVDVNKEVK